MRPRAKRRCAAALVRGPFVPRSFAKDAMRPMGRAPLARFDRPSTSTSTCHEYEYEYEDEDEARYFLSFLSAARSSVPGASACSFSIACASVAWSLFFAASLPRTFHARG